jgi:hypothetical protein
MAIEVRAAKFRKEAEFDAAARIRSSFSTSRAGHILFRNFSRRGQNFGMPMSKFLYARRRA